MNSGPKLSFSNQTFFYGITLLRHLTKNENLLDKTYQKRIYPELMSQRIINNIETIPVFEASEINGDTFHKMINKNITPFVIKGFLKDSQAVQKWTVEYFHENYGDDEIMLRPLKEDMTFDVSHRPGKLKEVTSEILSGEENRKYIMNASDILGNNPDLEAMLPMARVKEIFKKSKIYVGSQLFLGGKGTGSGIHCASGYNIFMNVYGRKKWTVIHPKFTPWLYPKFRSDAFYALSDVLHQLSFEEIEKKYPHYNRIPKMTYTLEPGDALINPGWYWHAVDNLTPQTIGVACRWFPPKPLVELNRFYAMLQAITPHMWKVWFHLLKGNRLKDHFNKF